MHKELYNKAYEKFTPDFLSDSERLDDYLLANRDSLVSFINQHRDQFGYSTRDKSILELGCGIGPLSFWLKDQFESVTAIDFSELAISIAQSLDGGSINFKTCNVLDLNLDKKFDFIIDSHLFHCLTKPEDRRLYLEKVKDHLSPNGVFLMESMVMQDRLQVPVGYELGRDGVLTQQFGEDWQPIRCIRPSLMLEEEVKSAGLELNYFYYHHELSFHVFEDYPSYPLQFLPKTVRLSSKLA